MKNKWIFTAAIVLTVLAASCCVIGFATPVDNTDNTFTTVPTEPAINKNSSVAIDPTASSNLLLSHSILELSTDGPLGHLWTVHGESAQDLQWSIEDTSVAKMYAPGIVQAIMPGTTMLTCTDGVDTFQCQIIVNEEEYNVKNMRLHSQTMEMDVGDTRAVEYIYEGPGDVCIFTSDPQILRIENGYYQAVSPGTAFITCTDGLCNTQCMVTVTDPNLENNTEPSPTA